MKISSISGLVLPVRDLDRTLAFYATLGFREGKREDRSATCYVNWFWLTFTLAGAAGDTLDGSAGDTADGDAGAGSWPAVYIKVDDLDSVHAELVAAGLKPAGEPRRERPGSREFPLLDPDGYRLVFFGK